VARFDVHANPIKEDRQDFPYVLVIQSDLLHRFAERVCVPLVRPQSVPGLSERFNPTITVSGEALHLHPLGIAVFQVRELRKPVATAKAHTLEIETALDMLLRGY
jgi:toxin CcdB